MMSIEIGNLLLGGYTVTETEHNEDGEVVYIELRREYLDQGEDIRAFYVDELKEEHTYFDKIDFVSRKYEDIYFDV